MLNPTQKTTDRNLAYLLLRVLLGINIGVHGASRVYSGVAGFATELVSQFAKTPLHSRMVYFFGVSLPFAEAVIGVLSLHRTLDSHHLLRRVPVDNLPYLRLHLAAGLDGCRMAIAVRIRLHDGRRGESRSL